MRSGGLGCGFQLERRGLLGGINGVGSLVGVGIFARDFGVFRDKRKTRKNNVFYFLFFFFSFFLFFFFSFFLFFFFSFFLFFFFFFFFFLNQNKIMYF